MPYGNIKMTDKDTNRANDVRLAFNSPIPSFRLSLNKRRARRCLDFHWYCKKIMHWNIPSNPQDVEQREGRIDRYKSLFVRRNIAKLHPYVYTWNDIFKLAGKEAKDKGFCELVHYWSIPQGMLNAIEGTDKEHTLNPLFHYIH